VLFNYGFIIHLFEQGSFSRPLSQLLISRLEPLVNSSDFDIVESPSGMRAVIDRPFYVVPACQPPSFCVVKDSLFLSRPEERELLLIEFCSRSEDNVNDAQRGTSKRRVAVADH